MKAVGPLTATICTLLFCIFANPAHAEAEPALPPLTHLDAVPSPLASKSILLKAAKAGRTIIAVGERGHIIRSTDDGRSWHQATRVPTQATLTDVHFIDNRHGWAVGHNSVILHTDDAGRNWARQFAEPGSDGLLLTIHFFDESHGFAMGDGSLLLETKDGGGTWQRHTEWRNTYGDFQLSDAFRSPKADTIYVAADFGAVFRFRDTGPTFRLMQTPAQSTFRRGFMLQDGTIWLAGAKDRLWRSNRNRTDWRSIKTNAGEPLNAGAAVGSQTLVFAGDNGVVVLSFDRGKNFTTITSPELSDYVDVLPAADGSILLLGSAGVTLAQLPAADDCPAEGGATASCQIQVVETRFNAVN